jgi:multidrug efflux pump subunit AcrB
MNDVKEAKADNAIPDDLKVTYTNDQSKNIRSQLSNLMNSMIIAFGLVVFILYLFLGLRNALLVGLSIPTSMLISFAIIGSLGYTINMIILFSLILALGMLVDNAIVTVENIYRFISQGYSIKDAAKYGTAEIAVPIISSTATTLAAFLPLMFWDSIPGQFMKLLPITLIIVLSSSLFVALVIVPVFARQFIHEDITHETLNKRKNYIGIGIMAFIAILAYVMKAWFAANLLMLFVVLGIINVLFLFNLSQWFKDVVLEKLENIYLHLIENSLKGHRPTFILVGMVVLLFGSQMFYSYRAPKIDFFPNTEPQYVNVAATLPEGTDIKTTDIFMNKLEGDVRAIIAPYSEYIESVQTTVGKGANAARQMAIGDTPNNGLIVVNFIDEEFRTAINTSDILKELSDKLLNKYPGVEIITQKNQNGPPTGSPINIEIEGDKLSTLLGIADSVESIITANGIQGIQRLKLDIAMDKPELNVIIDRDNAQRFGLSTLQIAMAIRTALFGDEAAKFKEGEEQYPINVRYEEKYRYDLDALMNQKITFRNKTGQLVQVPISSVAKVEFNTSYGAVKRIDLKRVVTFSSDVIEGYNANEINKQIKNALTNYKAPENYSISYTGEQQEQQDSMNFMIRAMLIAVSLILIILVSQFNSIVKPLIIVASVVFSTIGVFGGLATFNMDFVIMMTGIGIISLAGVVVNNAIVLIDYINYLKEKRKEELGLGEDDNLDIEVIKDLIVLAGKTRLRPVLLTAITTILGLVPMAIGLNIDFISMLSDFAPHLYFGGNNAGFWGPMAWTVIFGLTFATLLTLLVVPVMYYVGNKVKIKMYKK